MPRLTSKPGTTALAGDRRLSQLDGLRGVAVLAVILFHGFPGVVRGGWLGVDVFFVLSGYLITSLLVTEHERTGRVALRSFYARRALRLVPALLVVVAAHSLFSLWRPDRGAGDVARTDGVVLLYLSNWARAFAWDVHLDALAHTWSLAIEEQFYLLWPLALLLLLRCASLRVAAASTALAALGVAAWRAALFASGCEIERVYSGFDARSDGLLLGSAAALYAHSGADVGLATRTGRALSLAWVLLSVWAVMAVDFRSTPVYGGLLLGFALGFAAALPSVAVAPGRWTSAVLRSPPLVWTGRISYGLYLWNVVVLECVPFPDSWRQRTVGVAVVAITYVLAALSYVLVERPFLRLKRRYEVARGDARKEAVIVRPTWPTSPAVERRAA
jgi:peptidoglycan/LPS O-acetylase OafA/YrhL